MKVLNTGISAATINMETDGRLLEELNPQGEPLIHFYGWEGMKTAYNDIAKSLSRKDTNYIFGASMGQDWKQADIFFSQYYKQVEKKRYAIKIIFNENVRGHAARTAPYTRNSAHKVRFLPHNPFVELNLYKNTVLIVMLLKKPMVIRIHNKEAADAFKKFFSTMWELAKP